MKIKLLLEIKKVVSYYSELKRKKEMGFSITLGDVENLPVKVKTKKEAS